MTTSSIYRRPQQMASLIDSDYDEDDDDLNSEMDEIFSLSHPSDDECMGEEISQQDSDDEDINAKKFRPNEDKTDYFYKQCKHINYSFA